MEKERELKLAELAELSGVPPRTIRLYITRGLVPPPLRAGRDAAYGVEHLEALRRIRQGQRNGLTLEQIRHALAGGPPATALPEPEAWWTYELTPDVRVLVRGNVTGARLKRIRNAVSELQAALRKETDSEEEDE